MINLDFQFSSKEKLIFENLHHNNSLFLKYQYINNVNDVYKTTILPGSSVDTSGTVVRGYNIGIDIYITEEKKKAASKVSSYFLFLETQKQIVKEKNLISPLRNIYDDEELCRSVDCDLMKSFQTLIRLTNITNNYNTFSKRYRESIYGYLYGQNQIQDVFQDIEDITKIYYFDIVPVRGIYIGTVIFVFYMIVLITMVLSFNLLFVKKYEINFKFLPKDFWTLTLIGSILLLLRGLTEYGPINNFMCLLKPTLLSFGRSCTFGPLMYKLVVNFPYENKVSIWISKNRWKFISIFFVTDIILNGLVIIFPYNIDQRSDGSGRNFEVCYVPNNSITLRFIFIFMILRRIITNLIVIVLIFIEWNIKETKKEIQYIMSTVSINVICNIAIFIITYFDNNNYIYYFSLFAILYLMYAVSNYIFLFAIHIIRQYCKKNKEIYSIHNKGVNAGKTYFTENQDKVPSTTNMGKFSKLILNLHYKDSIKSNSIIVEDSISTPTDGIYSNSFSSRDEKLRSIYK